MVIIVVSVRQNTAEDTHWRVCLRRVAHHYDLGGPQLAAAVVR